MAENTTLPIYDEKTGTLLQVGSDLKHIAFIMDGNGRWAKKRNKRREQGHIEGAKAFERVVDYCGRIGVSVVTVYAFSTENWKRPPKEVEKIMSLLEKYLDKLLTRFSEYDVKVKFIGEKTGLSEKLLLKMEEAEKRTESRNRQINIALNYGGRAEITEAVNRIIRSGAKTVTEDDISAALYTAGQPEPDLIIRTAGERRLSNFLMWQAAYSEFYFTDVLWPDIKDGDVELAINDYYKRTRRYGGVV
jgi:undecaprenyl diphosphate synthase